MPLNKLENFIKNSEGRILYVNPNDLDATDGIENQGNSLTKPFETPMSMFRTNAQVVPNIGVMPLKALGAS